MSELSAYVAVQILLHYALALIVMAIAIMISNNLISMTLAILMCMNMTMLLYAMIERESIPCLIKRGFGYSYRDGIDQLFTGSRELGCIV